MGGEGDAEAITKSKEAAAYPPPGGAPENRKNEFNKFPDRKEIMNAGYTYTGIDGTLMITFHVDDHPCFQEWENNKYGNSGGNISVCITNQKPIIIFGQDKSVFN